MSNTYPLEVWETSIPVPPDVIYDLSRIDASSDYLTLLNSRYFFNIYALYEALTELEHAVPDGTVPVVTSDYAAAIKDGNITVRLTYFLQPATSASTSTATSPADPVAAVA